MGGSLDMVRAILKEEGVAGLFAGTPIYRKTINTINSDKSLLYPLLLSCL